MIGESPTGRTVWLSPKGEGGRDEDTGKDACA